MKKLWQKIKWAFRLPSEDDYVVYRYNATSIVCDRCCSPVFEDGDGFMYCPNEVCENYEVKTMPIKFAMPKVRR